MQHRKRRPPRLLCTEPLERRWLLSAPAAASPPEPAPPPRPVELVEIEPAEEGDDGDVTVDYGDLPRAVAEAFEALYPGANVLASEFGAADGEGGEYDITAESGGRVVDVTLAPDGEVLEVEHTVGSAELPREVLDWVRANFAGADVGDATVMVEDGVPHYEVRVTPAGSEAVEATVRLPDEAPRAPAPPPGEESESPGESGPMGPSPAAPAAPNGAADTPAQAFLESTPTVDPAAAAESTNERQARAASDNPPPADGAAPTEAVTGADDAPVPGGRAVVHTPSAPPPPADFDQWLPELAGLTTRWLPPDPAVIELGFREVLDAARALTKQLSAAAGGRTSTASAAAPVALLAALIAAEHMILLYSRRNRGGPVVVFGAEHSTWGWVLGSPDPCHDPSRPGRPGR